MNLKTKVLAALLDHAFGQVNLAAFSAIFCACMIVAGLYMPGHSNHKLFLWFTLLLMAALTRVISAGLYQRASQRHHHLLGWRNVFLGCAVITGVVWGLPAFMLLPNINGSQQILLILIEAGVTAGATLSMSAIPAATMLFTICCILPFVIAIAMFEGQIFQYFNATLVLYMIYSIIVGYKTHALIHHSIMLQFEKDDLLESLSQAKDKLELTNKKLELSATHDPLTQLANRRLFQEVFSKALFDAENNHTKVALLYLDVDHFKIINDRYGHEIGDEVLLLVAQRLKGYFGSDDKIFRLGGDELTIVIENVKTTAEVEALSKQLCELCNVPFHHHNVDMVFSISIGISIYPLDGQAMEALIKCADKRMYEVKARGGNGCYHYPRESLSAEEPLN